MGQSLVQLYVHIIFSTKHRESFLQETEFRNKIHAYLAGICQNQDCPAVIVGGVEDHVHLLCRMGKIANISSLLRELKRDSSKWAKEGRPNLSQFHWQERYGAFSVSPGHVQQLKHYIANQVEHHRKVSFQDEFRRICEKYGAKIDERYVWD